MKIYDLIYEINYIYIANYVQIFFNIFFHYINMKATLNIFFTFFSINIRIYIL